LRLKQRYFSSADQPVTLALQPGLNAANFQLARDVGAPIFQHINTADIGLQLEALAMGPDCTYVHVTLLNKSTWRKIADTGGKVSLSTIAESTVGVGTPAIQEAIDAGILARASFGTDAETFMTCDFFSQMRTAFSTQRLLALRASYNGAVKEPVPISCREVLEMATIGGARGANLEDKIGSLTPGKEADIVMLRTDRINVSPICNVPGAIVTLMDTSNVDTVFIGGNVLKWEGQLVDVNVGQVLQRISESRDGILKRTGWPLDLFATCCVHP
jgi:5-methylthioadenosine/S-adenosylhomocysteine deaminase